MNYLHTAIVWLDANKGKISLVATAVVGGLTAVGVVIPDWVIAILATQGISTAARITAVKSAAALAK